MRDVNNKRFIEFADLGFGLFPLKISEERDGYRTIQDAYNEELKIAKEYGTPKRFKIFEIDPNNKFEIDAFGEAFDWFRNELIGDYYCKKDNDKDKVVDKLYSIIQENEKQVRDLTSKVEELQGIVDNFKVIVGSKDE